MKNTYRNVLKKLLSIRENLVFLTSKWLTAIKKDFDFHNKNTEILAIWTVLFMAITGLFIVAINSNILVTFLLFILSTAIMLSGTLAATYYLHALKYHKQKQLLPKAHNFLNKSFKLSTLFFLIKIPHISILNNLAKNLKLAS